MDNNKLQNQLTSILSNMDIPEMRHNLTTSNLRWLARNIHVRNKDHQDLDMAKRIIKQLLKG